MLLAIRLASIESQRLGDPGVIRIGVAVDIGKSLLVGVHDLVAAV
jgi:hypothetical protein